jgi:hypothetical protein
VIQPRRGSSPQPRPAGRLHPGAGELGRDAVSWSPEAESYLELLASFVKIERELASCPPSCGPTRPCSRIFPQARRLRHGPKSRPHDRPGPGPRRGAVGQNATFGAWWNSETGQLLRQMTDRVQSVNPLLGDEIVFCASVPAERARADGDGRGCSPAGGRSSRARWKGCSPRRASLPHVFGVRRPDGRFELAVAPGVGARSPGAGRRLPFAAAIAERYRRGVGWLIGMDAPHWSRWRRRRRSADRARRHDRDEVLFLEQRAPAGAEENEVTFAFQGREPEWGRGWLTPAPGRGGVSAGRCPRRRLRVDSRAVAAVRGVHRADHQVGAGLRTRPGHAWTRSSAPASSRT